MLPGHPSPQHPRAEDHLRQLHQREEVEERQVQREPRRNDSLLKGALSE
jgi:hypothetical protein